LELPPSTLGAPAPFAPPRVVAEPALLGELEPAAPELPCKRLPSGLVPAQPTPNIAVNNQRHPNEPEAERTACITRRTPCKAAQTNRAITQLKVRFGESSKQCQLWH